MRRKTYLGEFIDKNHTIGQYFLRPNLAEDFERPPTEEGAILEYLTFRDIKEIGKGEAISKAQEIFEQMYNPENNHVTNRVFPHTNRINTNGKTIEQLEAEKEQLEKRLKNHNPIHFYNILNPIRFFKEQVVGKGFLLASIPAGGYVASQDSIQTSIVGTALALSGILYAENDRSTGKREVEKELTKKKGTLEKLYNFNENLNNIPTEAVIIRSPDKAQKTYQNLNGNPDDYRNANEELFRAYVNEIHRKDFSKAYKK
ncbi:MAG: hypothetical protein ACOCQ4_02405 [bacterium]